MTMIAVDTNIVVALVDSRDKWHQRALALSDALLDSSLQAIYFDCVINEAISALGRRAEEQRRSEEFGALLDQLMSLVQVDDITWTSAAVQRLFDDIVSICRAHQGGLNFHDVLLALVCKELKVAHILSFDRDFDEIAWLTRLADVTSIERLRSQASASQE
jgi:predicted nucleic acid-binding protein